MVVVVPALARSDQAADPGTERPDARDTDVVALHGGGGDFPLLVAAAMREVKTLGYLIGLHTAGIVPRVLERVLPLVDWVGMDLKADLARHESVTQTAGSGERAKRSKELMKGNIGTYFVLLLLIGIISAGIGFGAGFLLSTQPYLQTIVSVALQAVATIFSAAAIVVFYFSCRCKHEHFDLTLLAQGVGMEAPEGAALDAPAQG